VTQIALSSWTEHNGVVPQEVVMLVGWSRLRDRL